MIKKENFLIQVKYSDLFENFGDLDDFFLGFGGELYLSAEEILSYDPEVVEGINIFAENNKLPLRLHGPIAEIDYSRIEETISSMQKLYRGVFQLSKILDINFIVAHAEFDYKSDFPIEKQFENGILLWRALCQESSSRRIGIILENHCETKPEHLVSLVTKIKSPYLGLCVDIGHANAFSGLGSQKWLGGYPVGTIKEIHLADNNGDGDTHLPLGEGNIDFQTFFEALAERDEEHVFVLEPRGLEEAKKSLFFLRKIGFIE